MFQLFVVIQYIDEFSLNAQWKLKKQKQSCIPKLFLENTIFTFLFPGEWFENEAALRNCWAKEALLLPCCSGSSAILINLWLSDTNHPFFLIFFSTNSILCVKNCAFLDEFLFLESFSIYSSSPSISSFNPKIHNFLVCTLKCSRMQNASSIGSCEGLGHWIWTCYADSRCLKLIYENVFWYQYSWHWVGPIGQICQEYLIKNDFHILTLDIPIKVRGHKRSIQFSLIIMWWLAITTPPI